MPELLYEPPTPPRAITRVRSSVLLASRSSLAAAGHGARLFQEAGGGPWAVVPHWQPFWDPRTAAAVCA